MHKKLIYIVMIFLLSFLVVFPVSAAPHELKTLDIHVFIHEDGSATITEKRETNLSEGTENFIVIGNLGESTIQDFQVKEDGQIYETIDDWDTSWDREEKAFKSGIIERSDHLELVWGIGEYGAHTYEISYVVTDFIKQLEDSQMLFWQFVNSETNIPPQNVTVTIEADAAISSENERIWAFGYPGNIHFEDEKIIARSEQPLDKSDYVTILTEFKNSSYATNDVVAKTFEEIKEEAFEGSDFTIEDSFLKNTGRDLLIIMSFFGLIVLIAALVVRSDKKKIKQKYAGKYKENPPFAGEPYLVYAMLSSYDLTNLNHLLSTILLKWLQEEHVFLETRTVQKFLRQKETSELHFSKEGAADLPKVEAKLYDFFLLATDNGILELKKFKKWVKANRKVFTDWQQELLNISAVALSKQGIIDIEETEYKGKKYFKTYPTEKGETFEDDFHLFKNYLLNYASFEKQKPGDVKYWDEIILWASMLGITEEVYKQFKALYPTFEQEGELNTRVLMRAIQRIDFIANAVENAANGGFGGAASGGGGGGSYGGGSGGGTR